MKSSFPKCNKLHSKTMSFQSQMPSSQTIFWRRAFHKYLYIHIYEELFSKTQSTEFGLKFETHFIFGMALFTFWKRAFHLDMWMRVLHELTLEMNTLRIMIPSSPSNHCPSLSHNLLCFLIVFLNVFLKWIYLLCS